MTVRNGLKYMNSPSLSFLFPWERSWREGCSPRPPDPMDWGQVDEDCPPRLPRSLSSLRLWREGCRAVSFRNQWALQPWPNPRQMKIALFCFVTIPSLLLPPPIYKYGTFFSSVLDSLCVLFSLGKYEHFLCSLWAVCAWNGEKGRRGVAFTRQGRGVAPSVASAGCLCPVLVGRWRGLCRVTFLGNQITSQGAYGQCKI